MPRILDDMHFNILELLLEPMGPFLVHPVVVAKQNIDLLGDLEVGEDGFDAADGLKRPLEEGVEAFLATVVLPAYVFQVLPPHLLLLLRELETVLQDPVHELISD